MTFRDNASAILHYQPFEKLPVVSFGYWSETVQKWAEEGHITREEADGYCRYGDNGEGDRAIMKKLGFDFVTLDLEGFCSGSFDRAIEKDEK